MDAQPAHVTNLAVAVLRLPDGRLLLQRRTQDAPIAPGVLGFFGGHIEADETPDVCIKRELAEELSLDVPGLTIEPLTELTVKNSQYDGNDHKFSVFITDIPSDNLEVYEGERAESYQPAELLARDDLSEVVRRVVEAHAW